MSAPAEGLPGWFERGIACVGFCALSPVLLLCAVAVRMSSRGPALFRQERVGKDGRSFRLLKFRSMRANSGGVQVTARGDARITGVGRFLRKAKLDELPELWNVVRGELSLVGPRAEVPRYVDLEDPLWKRVLEARPGITDPVTLRLRNEEELIAAAGGDPEDFYRRVLQPLKLQGYIRYLERRTAWSDLGVLVRTVFAVVMPSTAPPPMLDDLKKGAEELFG
jgi:lipopolysaccharide/colanic/teichoic acid biosynthesis glycosyltransferase